MLSSSDFRSKDQYSLGLLIGLLIILTACQSPTARVAGGLGNLADYQNYCNTAVQLSILEKGGLGQLCYNPDSKVLAFSLMNEANSALKAVDIQVYTAGGVFPLDRSLSKDPGIILHGRAYFDDQFGRIQKVRFIPTIDVDGREFSCPNRALTIDEVPECG
jgi:hypothetical protein